MPHTKKASERVRELHELAKSRVNSHTQDYAYTITRLTKSEKDEYVELVDKFEL